MEVMIFLLAPKDQPKQADAAHPPAVRLAAACNIDAATLRASIERFNGFVATGKDAHFHRGDRAYDRYWDDPTVKPNPSRIRA